MGDVMKIIYIMGAGHIGSTVLDIVISAHEDLESLGEVSKFIRARMDSDDKRMCACDLAVNKCSFWVQVRELWVDMVGEKNSGAYIEIQKRFERVRTGWLKLFLNKIKKSSEFMGYVQGTENLYRAVLQVGGKDFLVDSSLTPRRAFALTMNSNIDLYLIHMVRDGRGVIWSLKKPGKKILTKEYVPTPSWQTIKYWITANLQSLLVFSQVEKDHRMIVRYEDFVLNPSEVLQRIGAMVGKDMSNLLNGLDLIDNGQARHTVGGNRVRMLKEIRIRADFAWMENLSLSDRRLFWWMAGWLAKQFGYKRHQTNYDV